MQRRTFVKTTSIFSATAIVTPALASLMNNKNQIEEWLQMKTDPVYDLIDTMPDLDQIMNLFPRPQGEPAFDPDEISRYSKKISTSPVINTGHPLLDHSIKVGLAHIDATFEGNHPKYGVNFYGRMEHDGFPPTIIAAVDALSLWGMNKRARELFRYWITNFVKVNEWPNPSRKMGEINYYGPSIAEYGQLLSLATSLYERAGGDFWWNDCFHPIDLMVEFILSLHAEALKDDGLISGVPEADTRGDSGKYFHNNAWIVKGLRRWARLCKLTESNPSTSPDTVLDLANKLEHDTLSAIKMTWPENSDAWWLPALKGSRAQPECLTDGREASYTNYRYWPELLSSGILPTEMAHRIVNARLSRGGQFCGMTRFYNWLDDWPLADYLYGLWNLGRKRDFLISLYGHVSYHQCEGHLTAYEQFNFPGDPKGSKKADYCLPSQLVAARAGRLVNKSG